MSKNTDLMSDDFEADARMHIEKIEAAFLDVNALKNSPDLINAVFRAVHSLKGTAGFFSFEKIVAVAHELENVFSLMKSGRLAIDEHLADSAMAAADCLTRLIDSRGKDDGEDITEIVERLGKYSEQDQRADEIVVPFSLDSEKVINGNNIFYININFNRGLGKYYKNPEFLTDGIIAVAKILEVIVEHNDERRFISPNPETLTEIINGAVSEYDTFDLEMMVDSVLTLDLLSAATEIDISDIYVLKSRSVSESMAAADKKADSVSRPLVYGQPGDFSLRIDVTKINALMDLSNEMILARNRLLAVAPKRSPEIMTALSDIDLIASLMQDRIMKARMQPIGTVFGKFPRVIRDTAKSLGKDISVEIKGEGVMLDKYLLDSLTDPITQIVRNSADHGIEFPNRRVSLGKPSVGKITLSAYTGDGYAVVEVSDDGGGIDVNALKQKALENGTATKKEISAMSENEVYALMFRPGISTAKQITNISGRGVGMDIVKTNIEKLGGLIEISSEFGKGTTMRLKAPLALSVITALIIRIDDIRYAVPEQNIVRISRSPGIYTTAAMSEIAARMKIGAPSFYGFKESPKYLIMKSGGRKFALAVDEAVETTETIISPLPSFFKNCPCYSGAAVLGDGGAVMVLDASGIAGIMEIKPSEEVPDDVRYKDELQIDAVVFKYCGRNYSADIDKIARITVVSADKIREKNGFFYADAVRIVSPNDFAPINKAVSGDKNKRYLIALKRGASGFLADEIVYENNGSESIRKAAYNEDV